MRSWQTFVAKTTTSISLILSLLLANSGLSEGNSKANLVGLSGSFEARVIPVVDAFPETAPSDRPGPTITSSPNPRSAPGSRPTPEVTAAPTPTRTPTATPIPTSTSTPTPPPTSTPIVRPSVAPSASPSPRVTPSARPSVVPTPRPSQYPGTAPGYCEQFPKDPQCSSSYCTQHPSSPSCIGDFCSRYPYDYKCDFCSKNPYDANCYFCKNHPYDNKCSYCTDNPFDPNCSSCRNGYDSPGCNYCDKHPYDYRCNYCRSNTSDPNCSFCMKYPFDTKCDYCSRNPADYRCSYCFQYPDDPACLSSCNFYDSNYSQCCFNNPYDSNCLIFGPPLMITVPVLVPVPANSQEFVIQTSDQGPWGVHLTDGDGKTIYLFLADKQSDGTTAVSNCYDECAKTWPPVILKEGQNPVVKGEAKAPLLGTFQRTDGATQLTYKGWPVYFYSLDQNPGDTLGQGVGSTWYVINPDGDKITSGGTATRGSAD